MTISIKATKVFYRNLNSKSQVVCNRGGARSSKSYSIAQLLLLYKFFQEKNKQILVLRKTLPALRLSAYKTWRDFISLYDLQSKIEEEKQQLNYYNPVNNNFLHFGSLDDPEKVKCFHPDTDILTNEGFKNIKDVKVGDLVLSVNPITKQEEYKAVAQCYVYDFNGDLFTCNAHNSYINFCVTPEHKMIVIRNGISQLATVKVKDLYEKQDLYKNDAFIIYDNNFYMQPVSIPKVQKQYYKGKVYCIEVPPYHNVVSRYKGRPILIGQSTEWNYVWLQEATDFTLEDYLTLKLRLSSYTKNERNQIFMCFNPIDEYHWIKTKLIDPKVEDLEEIHSTYRDNTFLSPDYIKTIESMSQIDYNKYRVYALGEWGRLENIIYSNWDVEQEYVTKGEEIYGLDFGFNNPCALLRLRINGNDIFEEELIYESELITRDLIKKMQNLNVSKSAPIYADPAEPDRIKEIREAGFNIVEANKPKDSVLQGIDFVKRFKIHCYKYSLNLIREKQSYSWKKDKQGRLLEEPVKYADHLLDSERMSIWTHLRHRFETINIRWI